MRSNHIIVLFIILVFFSFKHSVVYTQPTYIPYIDFSGIEEVYETHTEISLTARVYSEGLIDNLCGFSYEFFKDGVLIDSISDYGSIDYRIRQSGSNYYENSLDFGHGMLVLAQGPFEVGAFTLGMFDNYCLNRNRPINLTMVFKEEGIYTAKMAIHQCENHGGEVGTSFTAINCDGEEYFDRIAPVCENPLMLSLDSIEVSVVNPPKTPYIQYVNVASDPLYTGDDITFNALVYSDEMIDDLCGISYEITKDNHTIDDISEFGSISYTVRQQGNNYHTEELTTGEGMLGFVNAEYNVHAFTLGIFDNYCVNRNRPVEIHGNFDVPGVYKLFTRIHTCSNNGEEIGSFFIAENCDQETYYDRIAPICEEPVEINQNSIIFNILDFCEHHQPAVLFSVNETEIYEGFTEYFCEGEFIEVSFQEPIFGEYPFLLSWTINGDADHELSGENVEITSENQILFSDALDAGTYEIQLTSIVDGNGCSTTDLAPYNAVVTVHNQPALLFSVNENEIYENYHLNECIGTNIELSFQEALAGELPLLLSWTVNDDPSSELSQENVLISENNQTLFSDILNVGEYNIQITSVTDNNGCFINDYTPYNATININPEPSVLFSVNETEIYEGFTEYFCEGEVIEVRFQEPLFGEYPFLLSWTINGDTDHELSGENVEITSDNQLLFSDALDVGTYEIQLTSIIDGNGCSTSDLAPYNAVVTVHNQPALLFSVNDNEIYENYHLNECIGTNIELSFQEALAGELPLLLSWTVNDDPSNELSQENVMISENNQILFSDILNVGEYNIQITSVTDNNGCFINDYTPYNATININPEPSVIISSSNAECEGDLIETKFIHALSGDYPFLVSWIVNDNPQHELSGENIEVATANQVLLSEYLDAGIYEIQTTSIIDANGCSVSDYSLYYVSYHISPEPNVTFSINEAELSEVIDTSICEGEVFEIQFNEPVEGEFPFYLSWTINDNHEDDLSVDNYEITSNNQVFFSEILNAGVYNFQITSIIDGNGCNITELSNFSVNIYVDICNNIELCETTVSIYPNPATDELFIEFINVDKYHVSITDISGKLMYRNNINSNKHFIDLSEFASGTYFVVFENNTDRFFHKFIKY